MFRNYFKLAFRNLTRQKVFSVINISGLAVGLASSLTILLWVQDELSFDRFHGKAATTYRLTADVSDLKVAITPAPTAPALMEAFPEIKYTSRLSAIRSMMIEAGDRKFEEKEAYFAEPSLFNVFDFKLLQGDAKTALVEPYSVVITEDIAMKYFGTTDVLGKVVRKDSKEDFKVTGVLAKSGNSHLSFDLLLPWSQAATWDRNIKNGNWDYFNFYTYITFNEAKSKTAIREIEEKIDVIFKDHNKNIVVNFSLQPLTDVHLHSQFMADVAGHGNFQYVTALTIIAIFIVLIACINFMNLSTARSARRAKEVGLRKVAGAARAQLISQFLGESLMTSVISLAASLLLVFLCLPVVNETVGKQLSIDITDPIIFGGLLTVTFVTGILSGIYPALVLSGFTPVKVLKREVKGSAGGAAFRNTLVVAQFTISIVLMVGTTVVYQQLQYIRSKDLGFDRENLIHVRLQGDMERKLNQWRAGFQSDPASANVTIASALPAELVSGSADVKWVGMDPNKQIMFATLFIDENFIPVYNMEVASGRNFHKEMRGDSNNFMINETAARIMGFSPESAVGQRVELWETHGKIVGVIKDFNFKPLREPINPMIMRPNTRGRVAVVKTEPGKAQETIKAMEAVWNRLENVYPFSYSFVDQDLEKSYRSEQQIGKLFTVFAVLAVMISCLGLYGLSAYIAEQRTREIGIRKTLGASILHIMYLLTTRFVIPVLGAMIIAAPIAWYAMDKWLNGFAYRVNFNWLVVLIAGSMALVISLLTVSYESIKAARLNPVKSLREGC